MQDGLATVTREAWAAIIGLDEAGDARESVRAEAGVALAKLNCPRSWFICRRGEKLRKRRIGTRRKGARRTLPPSGSPARVPFPLIGHRPAQIES